MGTDAAGPVTRDSAGQRYISDPAGQGRTGLNPGSPGSLPGEAGPNGGDPPRIGTEQTRHPSQQWRRETDWTSFPYLCALAEDSWGCCGRKSVVGRRSQRQFDPLTRRRGLGFRGPRQVPTRLSSSCEAGRR